MSLPNACPKPQKQERAPRAKKVRKAIRSGPPKVQDRAYLDWIKGLKCIVDDRQFLHAADYCGVQPGREWIEPAHVKTKGSGGADRGNTVPLCPLHHDDQEGDTEDFEIAYSVNLKLEAARLLVRYIEAGEP